MMNTTRTHTLRQLTLAIVCATAPLCHAAFDWEQSPWGISVSSNGTPGSPSVSVTYPTGTKIGNALEVHYELTTTDLPQLWVFLTDGFWRQVCPSGEFLTSYRLFRYYSSDDKTQDSPIGVSFEVIEVTPDNQLRLRLIYSNNATVGDTFSITAEVLLYPPSDYTTSMTATITVQNLSGYDVIPCCGGFHRNLREQWLLFGASSMYVSDNLTESFPAWHNILDPSHNYVGNTSNASFLDDGRSVNCLNNGGTEEDCRVSTHDVKFIIAGPTEVPLANDVPHVVIPGYESYQQLVMKDVFSSLVHLQHGYDPRRHHRIELQGAAGLFSNTEDLLWSATYNREDPNMVDGDNIQVFLSMDHALGTWPDGSSQEIQLHLSTGEPLAIELQRESGHLRVMSNGGKLERSKDLQDWSGVVGAQRQLTVNPEESREFFRQNLDVLVE